jgi:hypothetical protein
MAASDGDAAQWVRAPAGWHPVWVNRVGNDQLCEALMSACLKAQRKLKAWEAAS